MTKKFKDNYIESSNIELSGVLDMIEDKPCVVVNTKVIDIYELLEQNCGMHISMSLSLVKELTDND